VRARKGRGSTGCCRRLHVPPKRRPCLRDDRNADMMPPPRPPSLASRFYIIRRDRRLVGGPITRGMRNRRKVQPSPAPAYQTVLICPKPVMKSK
jgi:hypothetical protein